MLLGIFTVIVLFLLIAPIFILVPLSFTSLNYFKFPPKGFSLQWYRAFFQNQEWVNGFIRSIGISILAIIFSLILGSMAAYAVTRIDFKFKKVFMAYMVTPMVIPVIIISVALYNSFAPMHLTNTILGIVLAHTLLSIPMVFVTLMTGLKGVDRNIELAASGLGAKGLRVFFEITLPQIRSSVISAALFAFTTSIDEITVTMFISGDKTKTLPVAMWEAMRNNITPDIAAVSTILIGITLVLLSLSQIPKIVSSKHKRRIQENM